MAENATNNLAAKFLTALTFKCPYKCGEHDIPYALYEEHFSHKCQSRYLYCPNSCGKKIRKHKL
mgnify:CR=1 FL=1